MIISSSQNPSVKEVVKLQKMAKHRRKKACFVVEGWRLVREVPLDYLVEVFVEENREYDTGHLLPGTGLHYVTPEVMAYMSEEVTSQGVLAVVRMKAQATQLTTRANPLLLLLENIQDPGNLGTILRTAEAAMVDQVLLTKGTVDLYNPKVIKSTMGAILRMDVVTEVDGLMWIKNMHEQGINTYAAHLKATAYYDRVDYNKGTCFVMGNEGNGLSDDLANGAGHYIKIPMADGAESLNVAMATGILIYEANRQRRL